MKRLVIATRNANKIEELRALLDGLSVQLLTSADFPTLEETVEDADTLEGNALKKAREVSRGAGLCALADDTGLEVGYLGGEPGVRSSRYAGEKATYAENCSKLLGVMLGVPARRRGARFRCVMAFVSPEGQEHLAEGILHGAITESPRGSHGFGYDPVFQLTGSPFTLAELTIEEKNRLSHRSLAVKAIQPALRDYFARR